LYGENATGYMMRNHIRGESFSLRKPTFLESVEIHLLKKTAPGKRSYSSWLIVLKCPLMGNRISTPDGVCRAAVPN